MIYDIAVIGAGPGGYYAAIRAAQLGASVLLVEKEQTGGVCLNRGCIPTKTLLKTAQKWEEVQQAAQFGIIVDGAKLDFAQAQKRKTEVIERLRTGMQQVLKSYGIVCASGQAKVLNEKQLTVSVDNEEQTYAFRKLIVAAGAIPMRLNIPGSHLPGVIDSDQLLELSALPGRLLVIGGGAVGIEFAAIFRSFGCEVTVVEMLPLILPGVDGDIAKRMTLLLKRQGIKIMTSAKVDGIEQSPDGLMIHVASAGETITVQADQVLMAAGRAPHTAGLGLEAAGVDITARGVPVNEAMQTNVADIYAIGDMTGRHMLAHVASEEGLVAAEHAMGLASSMHYGAVPACVFTTPEIAFVGLTEEAAKQQGIAVIVSKSMFAANGKAVSMGEPDGMVKTIVHADTKEVLGMHIFGPHASDLIMEGTIAVHIGLKAKDLAGVIHPHPTLSETMLESFVGVEGININQLKPRK